MNKLYNLYCFCFFAFGVVAKLLMFNHYAYHPIWIGLCEKMAVGCAIASFSFLFKDKRWMFPLLIFVDAWCVANLVYVRSNNLILDSFALTMADGMNGFWDSILIFFQWQDLCFFTLTLVIIVPFFFLPNSKIRQPMMLLILWSVATLLNTPNAFSREHRELIYGHKLLDTACKTSIMHTLIYVPLDYCQLSKGCYPSPLQLSEEQRGIMTSLTRGTRSAVTDNPSIIILVESLESWVINKYCMPHLYDFLTNKHVLYANHVKCQTIGAESADGQMIVLSGLLPIHEGATCFRFAHNEFPSVMKAQSNKSTILLPHDETVWNQKEMTLAYAFDTTLFVSPIDSLFFSQLDSAVKAGNKTILAITMSTHSPFKCGEKSQLTLPHNMPYGMYNYIKSFNVVDKGMAQFLENIETDSILQQYTLLITGDHTIFHKERRKSFAHYATKHVLPFYVDEGYLPLIIYSPTIKHNIQIKDICYQCDIYPTIMHMLSADDYYWKGFGVNLMDSTSRNNRMYSEEFLFDLSDKVIMNNYFFENDDLNE